MLRCAALLMTKMNGRGDELLRSFLKLKRCRWGALRHPVADVCSASSPAAIVAKGASHIRLARLHRLIGGDGRRETYTARDPALNEALARTLRQGGRFHL